MTHFKVIPSTHTHSKTLAKGWQVHLVGELPSTLRLSSLDENNVLRGWFPTFKAAQAKADSLNKQLEAMQQGQACPTCHGSGKVAARVMLAQSEGICLECLGKGYKEQGNEGI